MGKSDKIFIHNATDLITTNVSATLASDTDVSPIDVNTTDPAFLLHQGLVLEACVETLEQCVAADLRGAGRLELCDRLDLDGTTPPESLIRQVMSRVSIPVRVMIRPRGGNFIYTPQELEQMRNSIIMCKSLGVDGVVFGILDAQNKLDLVSMMPLIELAKPLNVIIHKAFDLTPDPYASMLQLEQLPRVKHSSGDNFTAETNLTSGDNYLLSVNAILTSGQAPTALEGAPLLKKMCDHLHLRNKMNQSVDPMSDHMEIIVAGRVTRENLPQLYQMIGAKQYHGKKL